MQVNITCVKIPWIVPRRTVNCRDRIVGLISQGLRYWFGALIKFE